MKAFKSILLCGAVLAAGLFTAQNASAQFNPVSGQSVNLGSNVEYNIGIGFGINFPMGIADDDIYSPMQKAWGLDFSFNFAEFYWSGLSKANQFFLTLGLENRSFRMRDNWGYGMTPITEELAMVPYNDLKMSALRVFSWNVGMGYRAVLDDDLDFMIGPIVNFNTASRMKTKYYDEHGDFHREKIKRWNHHELVTIEAMARLNFKGIGLYVKYNPFPLIDKEYGPEFTTWSVGIML